jgi:hypothetical protein
MTINYPNETQPPHDTPSGPFFPIERQIIVTGVADDIRKLVDEDPDTHVPRVRGLALFGGPRQMIFSTFDDPAYAKRFITTMEIRRDRVLGNKSRNSPRGQYWDRVLNVVNLLAIGSRGPVMTRIYGVSYGFRPEEVTKELLNNQQSLNLAVTFDRNTIVGDPQTIGGSPATGTYANAGAFPGQWAFGPEGIHCPGCVTGRRVRVGVFDTSPYDFPPSGVPSTETPDPHGDPWKVKVHHPFHIPPGIIPDMVPFTDHGLCVASLVHSVAPGCEIELVRVLDQYCQGDANKLADELERFINAVKTDTASGSSGPIDRAVINLSLHADEVENSKLEIQLGNAEAAEILVVSAAGNASEAGKSRSQPQYPANIDTVVGVAAFSEEGQPAYYGNLGDVLAPGSSVIARVRNGPPDCEYYRYVGGSSFATPLVAGLGALLMERAKWWSDQNKVLTPPEIRSIIQAGRTVPGAEPIADIQLAITELDRIAGTK